MGRFSRCCAKLRPMRVVHVANPRRRIAIHGGRNARTRIELNIFGNLQIPGPGVSRRYNFDPIADMQFSSFLRQTSEGSANLLAAA
jgi:hypothetical protein